MNERPEAKVVSVDFIAVMIVGIILSLLMCLSIFLTLYSLDKRQEEHFQLHEDVLQICKTIKGTCGK